MQRVSMVAAKGIVYEKVFAELELRVNTLLAEIEDNETTFFEGIEYSTMAYPAGNNGITEFILSAMVRYSTPE